MNYLFTNPVIARVYYWVTPMYGACYEKSIDIALKGSAALEPSLPAALNSTILKNKGKVTKIEFKYGFDGDIKWTMNQDGVIK